MAASVARARLDVCYTRSQAHWEIKGVLRISLLDRKGEGTSLMWFHPVTEHTLARTSRWLEVTLLSLVLSLYAKDVSESRVF